VVALELEAMVVPTASPEAASTSPIGSVGVKVTREEGEPRPAVGRAGLMDTSSCPLLVPCTFMVVEGELAVAKTVPTGRQKACAGCSVSTPLAET
jgi:hypothetical protein